MAFFRAHSLPFGHLLLAVIGFGIICAAYRLGTNFYYLHKLRNLYEVYRSYIKNDEDGSPITIAERVTEIRALFERAGLRGGKGSFIEPVGFSYATSRTFSYFDNIHMKRQDIVEQISLSFQMAIGDYKSRVRESINPIFWLETLIFLPAKIVGYPGLSESSTVAKIANVLGWIIAILAAIGKIFSGTWTK